MASESNLIRLKKLLEEGFVIEGITYHWEKKVLTVTVNLIKGSVRERIASVNEADFFNYIRHFEKVGDGYGNMVFMFIEDREEFEKRMKEVPKYKPLRDSHYIKVGERLLEKDVTITLLQKPGPGVRLARAHFFVKMSSNPEFQKLDLKDRVEIYSKDKDELVYRGYVQHLGFGKDIAYFECELGPRTFRVEKLSVEFIGFRSVDSLYFVTIKMLVTKKEKEEVNGRIIGVKEIQEFTRSKVGYWILAIVGTAIVYIPGIIGDVLPYFIRLPLVGVGAAVVVVGLFKVGATEKGREVQIV
jgi:hypothetical protein